VARIEAIPFAEFDFAHEHLGETIDLHEQLAQWREQSPMWEVQLFGQPAVLLLSYEVVSAAFKDEQNLPGRTIHLGGSAMALGNFVSTYEGSEHRIRRAILSPPFRRSVIPTYLELMRQVAHELIDEFAADGHAELVSQFTHRYPLRIITRLLELPSTDDARTAKLAGDLIRYDFDPEGALEAKAWFVEMVTPLIEARRAKPGNDLISVVIHSEFEGERLDDEDCQSFVRHLFPAAADTTLLGMGNLLSALLTQPELMAAARERPDVRTTMVEEAMRFDAPVANLPRKSPEDRAVDWRGVHLDPGTFMIHSIQSANRDPAVFGEPDRFIPDRKFAAAPLTFGFGTHLCVGNHLALAEIRTGLDALLERLPDIALAEGTSAKVGGTILRGPAQLEVTF
jgi:cytochrome P450